MTRVFSSCVVDHGFGPLSVKLKKFKICICYWYAKHTALMSKKKDLVDLKSG